jgi:hypothetical protein
MMKKIHKESSVMTKEKGKIKSGLLNSEIRVVNIGLTRFADDLMSQGIEVVQVDWTPPARGNPRLADLLSKLTD